MEAPEEFTSKLERQFRGRLRIRWSPTKEEWHIEERVGRGVFEVPHKKNTDSYARVRDGYAFVMSVKPREWMPCPFCNRKLDVPMFHTGEAVCRSCQGLGREARFRAAFYPLNDSLLRYLRQIDPERANVAQEAADLADAANAAREKQRERDTHNHIEDITLDNWRRLAQIPGVGYTGKEFKG
jgi:hypothetical protein